MFVPACRCALSEHAVSCLRTRPSGVELADALIAANLDGEKRPILGLDLELIAASACTLSRYNEKCCPAFVALMNEFDLDITFLTEVVSTSNHPT